MPLVSSSLRRRFLLLRALRWLPTGLLVPVLVLLALDRGLSLGQVGIAAAANGVVVLALELPTGGLADAIGRRTVLIAATVVDAVAVSILFVADSLAVFVLVFALQGIYRALESAPLDSWYVDAALELDPETDIEGALSAGGVAMGVVAASGAVMSSAVVAADPLPAIDVLAAPLLLAVLVRIAEIAAIATLMTEVRPASCSGGIAMSARRVPSIVGDSVELVRRSTVLLALVSVGLFWGFGVASIEVLSPPRIAEMVDSTDTAAVLFGIATAAVWLASATGAALVPPVARRLGAPVTAALFRILQGATVVTMALIGGVGGFLGAYLAAYLLNGAWNPVHQGLLHRQVDGKHRATVVSINSMTALAADAVGVLVMGWLAESASVSTALVGGGVALALAAPLYLPARREYRELGRPA